jgi:TRAP-type C4-dicarboxylate transport system substrate-binding protein
VNLRRTFFALPLAVSVSIGLLWPSVAQARELKVGVGLPPSSVGHYGMEVFAKTLKEKSGGEIEVKIFPLSLMNIPQMYGGIRDGVVDAGFFLPPVFPSEMPETQIAIDLAMLGTNAFAMAGAMTEYIYSCTECLAERLRANHVYLGSASTGPYAILSTKKISTVEELRGKKLRSAAAPWSRWASQFGAVAMNIGGNQIFEAVSQGTIDGTIQSTQELTALRLGDVVKHVTLGVPSGTFHGIDNHNVNRTVWRSLSEPQRRAVLQSAAVTSAALTIRYISENAKALAEAQQKGVQVHQASPDLKARTSAFIEADLAVVAQNAEKAYGVKNAAQKVSRFRQILGKWEKLTPNREDWDMNALSDIYWREIFSKLDPKTYGM